MFVRKKKNKSGSISIQIIDKGRGKYKVIKTVGSASNEKEVEDLWIRAHYMIPDLTGQTNLGFLSSKDQTIIDFIKGPEPPVVRVTGPERIYGRIFDKIGFKIINEELFRHIVLTRLVYPGSKLKTIDYLRRYTGKEIEISKVYRFLDKFSRHYKSKVEQIAFNYTKQILKGEVSVVFYDITTLYFESSDEDDLRKTGFSKDGKHQNPQILIGLLVGFNGYPIGYEMFEGNKFEGYTLIPTLKLFERKFNLARPIVVADAGLLSNDNLKILESEGYRFIIGGRVKNEKDTIKSKILGASIDDGMTIEIKREDNNRLIVSFSGKRAKKDENNRKRGLARLEKKMLSGKLTKSHINNRGYNKYLKLEGEINIAIDYNKFEADKCWDGLKGYITNSDLPAESIIENYKNLWQIEKAFRISKTDLKIRPIYHRLKDRISAHICISFSAYTIYKELERLLYENKAGFSAKRAAELTQTIYALEIVLPDSKENHLIDLKMDEQQKLLCQIVK